MYQIQKGLIIQKIDKETIIFDAEESVLYTLNETASEIFRMLKKGLKEEEIVEKIVKKYEKRFSVLPGIFSSWVAYGAFHNDFKKWMELDLKDVENKSFWYDLKIVIRSLGFILKLIIKSNLSM